MTNIQRKYRNNNLREPVTVVGEILPDDSGDDVLVCSVPANSYITSVVVINQTEEADNDAVVLNPLGADLEGLFLTEATAISVSDITEFLTGRIVVAVTFINPDVVNGTSVPAIDSVTYVAPIVGP